MGRIKRSVLAGGALVSLAFAGLWSVRRPLADDAIRRALIERGVEARYVVREIGFRTQRLDRIVIGDPRNPDLTADRIDVSMVPTWNGVRVTDVRASGVRLRARLIDGTFRMGAVDRLLPQSSSGQIKLPTFRAALSDVKIVLTTPYGVIEALLDGRGRADNGFGGRASLTAPVLTAHGCRINGLATRLVLTTRAGLARFDGPLAANKAECAGTQIAAIDGRVRGEQLAGGFAASLDVGAASAAHEGTRATRVRFVGGGGYSGRWDGGGTISAARVALEPALLARTQAMLAWAHGTPIGPVAKKLRQAIVQTGRAFQASAEIYITDRAGITGASVGRADLRAPGGARLSYQQIFSPVGAVPNTDPPRIVVGVGGGELPSASVQLHEVGRLWFGTMSVAPYSAGTARVALAPLRLALDSDGSAAIDGAAVIDGPVGDGRVTGLRVPVVARRSVAGGFSILPGCTSIKLDKFAIGDLRTDPATARLCPTRGSALLTINSGGATGGARLGPLRLTGSSGTTPFKVDVGGARADLDGRLSVDRLDARLGAGNDATRIAIERVAGRGASGHFAGLSGALAGVPLIVTGGQGSWTLEDGALTARGRATVADTAASPRFRTLSADIARVRFVRGRIAVTGSLREPSTNRTVTNVTIEHDLATQAGEARLRVNGLTFGKTLQPELLTPLTIGVVADVQGQVDGTGVIRWNRSKVSSTGQFRTDGLDFAAAFGPVVGASGEVEFDDLLALSTPAGQRLRVASINPGVEATDGTISYRLRPNRRISIERGRWPFAGGELLLDPAEFDLANDGPRTLTLRVVGLDAGKFIERLQLENIAATGTFDGVLPIVFDASGGQISAGRIVARGGGTLAYVGDVTNAQTNAITRLAFDALKAIRYENLAIELDGALDGEIVSRILFTGTNQAPVAPTGLIRSLTGLPFKFNIVVRAPFRGLVNTARTLQDPSSLIAKPVQPRESGAER